MQPGSGIKEFYKQLVRMQYAWILLPFILVRPAAGGWRTLAGVVVDISGRPIAGARIDHTAANVAYVTDANGRLGRQTSAPRW